MATKKRGNYDDLVKELGLDPDLDYDIERGLTEEPPVPEGAKATRRLARGPAQGSQFALFDRPTRAQPGARWVVRDGDVVVLAGAVRNRHGRDGRVILEVDAAYADRVAALLGEDGPVRPLALRAEEGGIEADAATLRPFRSVMPMPGEPITITFDLPE